MSPAASRRVGWPAAMGVAAAPSLRRSGRASGARAGRLLGLGLALASALSAPAEVGARGAQPAASHPSRLESPALRAEGASVPGDRQELETRDASPEGSGARAEGTPELVPAQDGRHREASGRSRADRSGTFRPPLPRKWTAAAPRLVSAEAPPGTSMTERLPYRATAPPTVPEPSTRA